jgi:hypothetical protein
MRGATGVAGDVRCHCVREHVEDVVAKAVSVKSKDNRSDVHAKNASQGVVKNTPRIV